MTDIALTYDDIQLVPRFSSVSSRQDINLETKLSRNYSILIPLIASPMDTVCEQEMAFKMFTMGGVGCIHRFLTVQGQARQVLELKSRIYGEGFGGPFENWGDAYAFGEKQIPIMAAIGVGSKERLRADALVEAGANVLLIDVAHGHHQNVIEMIKYCKNKFPEVDVIAGSIATAEAAEDLQNAGADGLRVGIGGGSLCTTRVKTGFGIPNVTCIEEISKVAKVPVMADGGIRSSGDIAKSLAVGAQCVMIGSLIAGTDEAPGKIIETKSGLSKKYRGSASLETKSAHGQEQRNVEGESTTIPYKGGVSFVIKGLLDGVRSALSYAGAISLDEYAPNYVQITNSGIREAQPHLI
jgi:IMP dehydrogenase